jgi:uncharacterized membrane protein YqaE (UPF0057 family)
MIKKNIIGENLNKRPITPSYIVFYILFSPDTWRVLMGIIFAAFLAPLAVPPDMGVGARVLIYIMMATVGYSASGIPGRYIANTFKKLILGDKAPK